jgi:uncharacterized membrane protein YheB (UPF0754 family)
VGELLNKEINLSSKNGKKFASLTRKVFTEIITSFKESEVSQGILNAIREVVNSKKEQILEIASEKILKVIEKELPIIMESIDIEGLVEEKVNSLPIEEIESIILKLIKDELKYITLLGGVLGFLIGSIQLLVVLL